MSLAPSELETAPAKMGRVESLLALQQWLSPGFPTGSFAYSQGLETRMNSREVADIAAVRDWVTSVLRYGSAKADAVLLCAAFKGQDPLDELIDLARALAPTAERAREMEELGHALTRNTNAILGVTDAPAPYAIALGRAARALDVEAALLAQMFLHAQAASLISAAVRFVPLGQTEGQQLLAELAPMLATLGLEAADSPLEAIGSFTLGADLASALHETLDVRIFRT